jgi:ribonuclease R
MKKTKTPKNQESTPFMEKEIIGIFTVNPNRSLNYKQVAAFLNVTDRNERIAIGKELSAIANQGILLELNKGKYRLNPIVSGVDTKNYLTGIVDMKQTGKAYVIVEDPNIEDIFINSGNTGHSLNGDLVKVHLFPKRKNKKLEGEIVEIIKRAKKQFVGTLIKEQRMSFFMPDNTSMPVEIMIEDKDLNGAKDGDKVVVAISEWPQHSRNPFGEVIHTLGRPGNNDVEMNSILAEFEFPLCFPKEVEDEAERIPEIIPEKEIKKRRDFRNILTLTIDPYDAKDFDDALSIQKLENGNWEIGVHIADVSYYVKPGSKLEAEAYLRATSIYLVDRTIPMLPEKLSNKVCSLRPDEDKLCFSAVFELDDNAKIHHEWFGKTIIRSNRRFNYDEVQEIIENKKGELCDEILTLDRLAKKLRSERFSKGAINFESQEVKFNLDENAKPISVYVKVMKDSNRLIEDFMLLANRKVAEFIGSSKNRNQERTFVYRVHDEPNSEKLVTFSTFLKKLGYQLRTNSRKSLAESYNTLFEDIKGKGEQQMIETIAIRTMMKAYYTTENIGHYGLGFRYYTHFTSPIRRYPDVMVHRLLEMYLDGATSQDKDTIEEKCKHSSQMEIKAAEAERASVKYKQAEFLLDKVGEEFWGLISGVSKWGLFVMLEDSHCEGLVANHRMNDDFYTLDNDNYQLVGTRYKKVYRLGDRIKVKVVKVDLAKKLLDYELVEELN